MTIIKNVLSMFRNKLTYCTVNKNNKTKINYLKKEGSKIGQNTRLYCDVSAFGSEPYLIKIGENCLISADVHLITHDGGVKVLSDMNYFEGERMDIIAPIKIGNNVYIGAGAYIMPGVTIGDNVVVGAMAVVTKDIPNNTVVVGVPARVIKTTKQYYEDAKQKGRLYPTARMTYSEKKNI